MQAVILHLLQQLLCGQASLCHVLQWQAYTARTGRMMNISVSLTGPQTKMLLMLLLQLFHVIAGCVQHDNYTQIIVPCFRASIRPPHPKYKLIISSH